MAKAQRLFSVQSIQLDVMESNPPVLAVTVSGIAVTSGWTSIELAPLEKTLSADGILDLDFVGVPPTGIVLPVLTPVTAGLIWRDDVDRLVGVKVYARSGDMIELVTTKFAGPVTTMALGEEDPVTTKRLGEEGFPTTFRRGEEDVGTTLRIGEEFPKGFVGETSPRLDDPKPFQGETNPRWDDPKPFFGETDPRVENKRPYGEGVDWFDPDDFNPFGRR